LTGNPKLNTLNGFDNLSEIEGDFNFGSTLGIIDLLNFEQVSSITGDIRISDNDMLSDFCVFQDFMNTNWTGNCTITNNSFNPTCEDIQNGNCSQ